MKSEIQKFKDELMAGLSGLVENKTDQSTFMQAALQFANDPKITEVLKTDLGRSSIIGAMLKAAMFGFSLAPEMGQCYVVPRSINAKEKKSDPDKWVTVYVFQIGYKGWQDLAFSSDAVLYFDYGTVYEKDQFEVVKGINQNLIHIPFTGSPEGRGKITHFYATACLSNGIQVFDYISIQDAENYRQMSDTQYDGYGKDKRFSDAPKGIWAKHYDQMALRLPLRNICTKKIRRSPRIANAVLSDGGTSYVKDGKTIELPPNEVLALEKPVEVVDAEKLEERLSKVFSAAVLLEIYNENPAHGKEYAYLFTARKNEVEEMIANGQMKRETWEAKPEKTIAI